MEWLSIAAAIVGGLSTGLVIGLWLARRELKRILDVVDRMPPAEWFKRVEDKIDLLDPERLSAHYERVHAHAQRIQAHDVEINTLRREVDDHETRLRVVEKGTPA